MTGWRIVMLSRNRGNDESRKDGGNPTVFGLVLRIERADATQKSGSQWLEVIQRPERLLSVTRVRRLTCSQSRLNSALGLSAWRANDDLRIFR